MSETTVDRAKLSKPFPAEAIKQRAAPGSGKQLDYVSGHTVIHRLNDAAPYWDFTIKEIHTSNAGTDRDGNPIAMIRAHVALTIPGMGTREHIGVQAVRMNSGEDLAKGAITDALKKAATLFGVGLELYGFDYEDADAPVNAPRGQGGAQTSVRGSHPTEHVNRETGEITRPQATAGQPATEKQIKFLHAIAKDAGLSHTDLHDRSVERYGKGIADLDRAEISALIDGIKGGAPAQHAPTPIRQAPTATPDGDDTSWTHLWKELREAGIPNGNINAATDLIGTWNNDNPAALLAQLRLKVASMPQTIGTAGADRFTQ